MWIVFEEAKRVLAVDKIISITVTCVSFGMPADRIGFHSQGTYFEVALDSPQIAEEVFKALIAKIVVSGATVIKFDSLVAQAKDFFGKK